MIMVEDIDAVYRTLLVVKKSHHTTSVVYVEYWLVDEAFTTLTSYLFIVTSVRMRTVPCGCWLRSAVALYLVMLISVMVLDLTAVVLRIYMVFHPRGNHVLLRITWLITVLHLVQYSFIMQLVKQY